MKPFFVLLSAAGHKTPPLVDIDATVIVQLGIFLVLLIVLTRYVFRPYLALRNERGRNIEGARVEAGQLTTDAAAKLARYEEQIARTRKETAAGRAELRAAGEGRASQVLEDAHAAATARVEAARQKLAKSVDAAQLALRTRGDQIAKVVAEKLLGREV